MVVAFTDHVDIANLQGCANLVDPWLPCVKVSILSRFIINAEKSRSDPLAHQMISQGTFSQPDCLTKGCNKSMISRVVPSVAPISNPDVRFFQSMSVCIAPSVGADSPADLVYIWNPLVDLAVFLMSFTFLEHWFTSGSFLVVFS
ncbi:hypothetical protein Tco_0077320 [Tanacetum coccineum]